MKNQLITSNSELLVYETELLQIQILGGIRLSGLDRLRVTLKLTKADHYPLRYNLDLYNTDLVEKLIRRASEHFELELKEIRTILMALIDELEEYRLKELETTITNEKVEVSGEDKEKAISYLKQPKLMEQLLNDVSTGAEVIAEEYNALLLYIILASKKQSEPLSAIIFGESGTGKTTLMQGVANLLPPEEVITFTSLSKTSLYYMSDLVNKSLLIEDLTGVKDDETMFALRELVSNQKLTRSITEKNHKGEHESKTVTIKTRLSMASCTTNPNIYYDNMNRSIPLFITTFDQKREAAIFKYKKQKASGDIDYEAIKNLKQLFQNMHRILQPIDVRNPFAQNIQLPESVKSPKRSLQLYLNFIQTVTWMHQYQRKVKTDKVTKTKYIEVTQSDVIWSNKLLKNALLSRSDELSQATRNFLIRLKSTLDSINQNVFTVKDIKHLSHISNIKRYLKELRTYEYIRINSGNQHQGFEYKLIDDDLSWNMIQKDMEDFLKK